MLFTSQKPIQVYEEFLQSSKTKIKKLKSRSFLRKIITQLSILSSAITQITCFFSAQLKRMASLLVSPSYVHKASKAEQLMTFRNKKDSSQEIDRFYWNWGQLQQTSAIKQTISKEFTQLKALEQRSNYLRMTNQQLMTRRKSLSNSKTNQSKEKLEFTPKERQKNNYLNEESHHIVKNHPPIRFSNTSKYIQPYKNSKTCFESAKSLFTLQISQNNSQKYHSEDIKQVKRVNLQCSQGHDYYIGQTRHNLPHGFGNLVRCCAHLPIKLSQKILQYSGCFEDGKFQGQGVLKLKGGVRFEGSFRAGMRHGKGTIYLGSVGERGYWQYDMLRV